MDIKKQFEQNFLDGEKLPDKAVTFSATGGFEIAEYFYKVGREETVREVYNEIEKLPLQYLTMPDKKGEYRLFSFSGINKSNLLYELNKLNKQTDN